MTTQEFYDQLASLYDLVYDDWEGSMARQGAAIGELISSTLGTDLAPAQIRVLDASCGIGTQTLPLARQGYRMTACDLSPGAIGRLRREVGIRGLTVESVVADMRTLRSSVPGPYDVALTFDNSLPHLLSDAELTAAFSEFLAVLRPGGLFACSIRDYSQVKRGQPSIHAYGERTREGVRYRLRQEWNWDGPTHYHATMVVEREHSGRWTEAACTTMRYYAILVPELMGLLQEAGFADVHRNDAILYQPVLFARRAA
ncbi:MAG: class I SAM-dependent methyltransferase [Gemmatimonadaceae bacterium]|nr:class I SAM-dependent methyltransferase [Gemmatimonadaceae bacterium]